MTMTTLHFLLAFISLSPDIAVECKCNSDSLLSSCEYHSNASYAPSSNSYEGIIIAARLLIPLRKLREYIEGSSIKGH